MLPECKVFPMKFLHQAGNLVPSQPKVASVTRSKLVRGQARSYRMAGASSLQSGVRPKSECHDFSLPFKDIRMQKPDEPFLLATMRYPLSGRTSFLLLDRMDMMSGTFALYRIRGWIPSCINILINLVFYQRPPLSLTLSFFKTFPTQNVICSWGSFPRDAPYNDLEAMTFPPGSQSIT